MDCISKMWLTLIYQSIKKNQSVSQSVSQCIARVRY